MIKIKNRNKKKNFSNAVLLSCLAEDLAYENKCLMEIISDFNQIVEVELGKDIERLSGSLGKDRADGGRYNKK